MNAIPLLEIDPPIGPIAVSPSHAAKLVGVGRTTLYAALSSGELRSLKIGTRRLITVEALKLWLANAERLESGSSDDEC